MNLDALSDIEKVVEKVREIQRTLEEAKSSGYQLNEAQTEFVIIDPLLNVLGYGPLQIYKRGHDSVTNNYPDYTLLPNTPQKWFLEVKKLDMHLQDGEAAQAVNYANNQGAEWAVLTNGRSWYIYNAHLPKPLIEKRVLQINDLFSDADAAQTLALLSKPSMQSGGLAQAWISQRVITSVRNQLETPNSDIRKHLRRIINQKIGTSVDEKTIGKAIASLFNNTTSTDATTVTPVPTQSVKNGTSKRSIASPAPTVVGPAVYHTFAEIAKDTSLATFRKPQRLRFEDGHEESINAWADAARFVVEYIGQTYSLPLLPFITSQKGKKCFLNTTNTHGNGNTMNNHRVAQVGSMQVYIDTNRSASDMAVSLSGFLAAIGAPTDAIKISIECHKPCGSSSQLAPGVMNDRDFPGT